MKICGIISEFDPFHNGHSYLIDSVRAKKGADAVVCVMSGDFTQRGAPAIADKFIRAEAAVRGGADLVLELPFCYAVNGAGEFAKGGIRILKGLGCIDALAFGSESGDAQALMSAARLLAEESASFSEELKKGLSRGLPYPESYAHAAQAFGIGLYGGSSPNDVLACEYLKQCVLQGFEPEVLCVRREGAAHGSGDAERASACRGKDVTISCGGSKGSNSEIVKGRSIVSASAIRKTISEAEGPDEALRAIASFIPEESLDALQKGKLWDSACGDRLFSLLRHELMRRSSAELANILEAGEGIESRLKKSLQSANDTDSLILGTKTKRYTYVRISRMLMQLLAGMTKDRYAVIDGEKTAYARVLAFSDTGAAVLRTASDSADIPIYTNLNKKRPERESEKLSLDTDVLASDIYSNLTGKKIYDGSDLTCNPIIVRI